MYVQKNSTIIGLWALVGIMEIPRMQITTLHTAMRNNFFFFIQHVLDIYREFVTTPFVLFQIVKRGTFN